MVQGRLKVVVTRALPEVVETRMMELFDVELNHDDVKLSREACRHVGAGGGTVETDRQLRRGC